MRKELAVWEAAIAGDYLSGKLSAVDFTLYPQVALALRVARRKPGVVASDLIGPSMSGWMRRMEALACTRKTWPPHWK